MEERIVFFDGTCGLCNGFVNFLLVWDRRRTFRMSPLQGETAERLLPKDRPDSVVLFENGKMWVRSEAVIRILTGLGGIGRVAVLARLFPRALRDFFYDRIAAHRYGWFGQRDTCRLPSPDEPTRFLP